MTCEITGPHNRRPAIPARKREVVHRRILTAPARTNGCLGTTATGEFQESFPLTPSRPGT